MVGEWTVGQWKVGVTSFQKIYGLYGLKHHTIDLLSMSCTVLNEYFPDYNDELQWSSTVSGMDGMEISVGTSYI